MDQESESHEAPNAGKSLNMPATIPSTIPAVASGAQQTGAQPPPGRGIHPLRSLSTHPLVALAVMSGVILAGIPLAWVMGRPAYFTSGVIYVSPRFVKNLEEDKEFDLQSNSQYREFVQQQVRTINRYDIVFEALQKLGDRRYLWQRPAESDRRAAERLQGALRVIPVPDTYQISIGLERDKPDGLADIVNIIMETYVEKAKAEQFYGQNTRLESLTKERRQLLEEAQKKTQLRTDIAQELGVSSFTESLENPYDRLLANSKEALATARRARLDAEAQLAAVDTKEREGADNALRALALEIASGEPGLNSLKANLNQRRSELLGKASGLSSDHPGRQVFEEELREIDLEIKRASTDRVNAISSMILEKRRAEVYRTRRVERNLTAETDKLSTLASWFAGKYQEAMALGLEIERARKRAAAIDDRMDFFIQESHAPGFVRLFSLARPPDAPAKGGRKKLLVAIAAAGVLLGLAAPTAVDVLDPRIHAANDVERILGFPPMGWILDRDRRTVDFVEDQFLRLASVVNRERGEHNTRVLLMTSIKAGGGSTSLALELAKKLSSAGIPTVAIEANAFRPDPRFSDGSDYPGLAAVLSGQRCLDSVLLQGNSVLPDRIGIGSINGKRSLPSLRQLGPILQEIASRYALVILDAPPISLAADTAFLVGVTDATILVIEAEALTRPVLQRVVRTVERLKPAAVGCILNRVRVYGRGGYFASMIAEFQTGQKEPPSTLLSPWLWK